MERKSESEITSKWEKKWKQKVKGNGGEEEGRTAERRWGGAADEWRWWNASQRWTCNATSADRDKRIRESDSCTILLPPIIFPFPTVPRDASHPPPHRIALHSHDGSSFNPFELYLIDEIVGSPRYIRIHRYIHSLRPVRRAYDRFNQWFGSTRLKSVQARLRLAFATTLHSTKTEIDTVRFVHSCSPWSLWRDFAQKVRNIIKSSYKKQKSRGEKSTD